MNTLEFVKELAKEFGFKAERGYQKGQFVLRRPSIVGSEYCTIEIITNGEESLIKLYSTQNRTLCYSTN